MIYLLSPLSKEGTVHLPMIRFITQEVPLVFDNIDLLMFTSKQAVKSAEQLNPKWKEIPCIAIGKATAKEITQRGGKVIYHPKTFTAQDLAQEIITSYTKQKILYLRPEVIAFESKAFLKAEGIEIEEQIIYKTECSTPDTIEPLANDAIIIFTSPSTIRCFFQHYVWQEGYRAVSIGTTTSKYLPEGVGFEIASEPTVEAAISKAKEIANFTLL